MRYRYIVLLSCIVSCLLLIYGSEPSCSATIDEYRQSMTSISKRLGQALGQEKKSAGSGRETLRKLLAETPSSIAVDTDSGAKVTTDLKWLRREMVSINGLSGKARAERISSVMQRVETLRTAPDGASKNSQAELNNARSILSKIIARKEYKPSKSGEWLARVVRRVFDAIGNAVAAIQRMLAFLPRSTGRIVGWMIVALAVAIPLAVIWYFIMRYGGRGNASLSHTAKRERRTPKQKRPTVESLLAEAERKAADGMYKDAFRHLYLAGLLHLDKVRLITYAESGTNWEYMRLVRHEATPEQAEAFHGMTSLFDRIIYGHQEATREDYATGIRQFRALEAAE